MSETSLPHPIVAPAPFPSEDRAIAYGTPFYPFTVPASPHLLSSTRRRERVAGIGGRWPCKSQTRATGSEVDAGDASPPPGGGEVARAKPETVRGNRHMQSLCRRGRSRYKRPCSL